MELVVGDFLVEYPDMISVIKLSGLLHSDDNCALKEVARQLCLEHQLQFSKAASFDDNSQFMGKQRLLYSLLDAMQSITSRL
ncbi:hypothetical protein K1719_025084 [Acacia pycnantha]|nr:hypothetical protein K1719_025084 [Acacia pycnantha]